MIRKYLTRKFRRKLGFVFALLGTIIWVSAASLHLAAQQGRNVSISHVEARTLGVIVGGAVIAGGIILFASAV